MNKKKLLVITSTLPRFQGDTEPRFVFDLSSALAEHYEVTLLAPADPAALLEEVIDGIRIKRYRYFPLRAFERLAYPGGIMPRLHKQRGFWLLVPFLFWGLLYALYRETRRNRYDAVHCHWLVPQGLACRVLSAGKFPPYIVTSHGGDMMKATRSKFWRFLCNETMDAAASVTAVSQHIVKQIEEAQRTAEPPTVPVIPMGVNLAHFSGSRQPAPGKIDLPENYVIFVGRLVEKKGLAHLLDALSTEPLLSSGVSLVVVGEGPERWALEHQARALNIVPRVKFIGTLNHTVLPGVIRGAKLCCIPSIVTESGDSEGTPTVIFEAFACGVPCVASNVAGIPNVVISGRNGFLVEPGDVSGLATSCHRLLSDAALRERFAGNITEDIKRYDWQIIGDQFHEVIDAAVGQT